MAILSVGPNPGRLSALDIGKRSIHDHWPQGRHGSSIIISSPSLSKKRPCRTTFLSFDKGSASWAHQVYNFFNTIQQIPRLLRPDNHIKFTGGSM
ncbi:hypothetical protein AG1IA_03495 [Rhizoctonia solani AG-1 IA]|uniref:Uncharacterized protein n=1 Tax=Thanatephorus cucumeris (strain AG1-IA) TaxID=983506 RepID=L8WWU9_THACA|nr:hypothetical protein AG1IA_03495 [Rhizoctonia solani AG-1 IA]